MELIKPHDKVTASSRWALRTAAFDINNTPSGSYRLNPNSCITADTPKGILGGQCMRASAAWEAREGIHTAPVLGLATGQSEGNAFENTPAIASGVVPIYMNGGAFTLYMFETHAHETAFADILSTYDVGDLLYCSAFALLTTELPSDHGTPGEDTPVAVCAKAPVAADLSLGIKLLV